MIDLDKNWFRPLLALLLMWSVEWLQCDQRRTVLALFRLLCLKLLSIHLYNTNKKALKTVEVHVLEAKPKI